MEVTVDPQVPRNSKLTAARLFIALPVPDAVKEEILRTQEEFRRNLPKSCAHWTRPAQWHLTLKFLGDVEMGQIATLTEMVRNTCGQFAPLKLRAERIGCFPDLGHPRVIWAGVHDEGNQLIGLAQALESATAAFTAQKQEGVFTGHITIARTSNLKRPQVDIMAGLVHRMTRRVFGGWTAHGIEIMRSELLSSGAKHTCLAQLSLGGMLAPGTA